MGLNTTGVGGQSQGNKNIFLHGFHTTSPQKKDSVSLGTVLYCTVLYCPVLYCTVRYGDQTIHVGKHEHHLPVCSTARLFGPYYNIGGGLDVSIVSRGTMLDHNSRVHDANFASFELFQQISPFQIAPQSDDCHHSHTALDANVASWCLVFRNFGSAHIEIGHIWKYALQ